PVGRGEVVGAVGTLRQGVHALAVIGAVKARLDELRATLPAGVQVVPTYDRSELIRASIHTLRLTLFEEMIVVSLVILVFLLHVRSTLVPVPMLPISLFLPFIPLSR